MRRERERERVLKKNFNARKSIWPSQDWNCRTPGYRVLALPQDHGDPLEISKLLHSSSNYFGAFWQICWEKDEQIHFMEICGSTNQGNQLKVGQMRISWAKITRNLHQV